MKSPKTSHNNKQQLTEKKLIESEQRLRFALDATQAGMWEWFVQSGELNVDSRWTGILGFEKHELEPISIDTWQKVCHPDDIKNSDSELQKHFNHETDFYQVELRMKHKDGHWVWIKDRGKVIDWDAETGKPIRMIGTHIDISDEKKNNQALEETITKYKVLFESFPVGITISDKNGDVLECNLIAEELLGLQKQEIEERALKSDKWEIIDTTEKQMPVEEIPGIKSLRENCVVNNVEMGVLKNDGNYIWLNVTAAPVPLDDFGVAILYNDISEKRKIEKELKDSQRKLSSLFKSMTEMVALHEVIFDDNGIPVNYQITDCNEAYTKITGIKPENAIGKLATDVYQNDNPPYLAEFSEIFNTGNSKEMTVFYEPMNKHFIISIVQTGPSEFATITTDITEIKQVEKELEKANSYISNIIDSMPSLLISVDEFGKITQWNRKAQQTTGINSKDAIGKDLNSVFPEMISQMEQIKIAIRDRNIHQATSIPRKVNNEVKIEDITIYPLIANGVNGAVIRIDDKTEQRRLEEMMIQSEKMLSVGGLAAGMAHEINNPLAGIIQNAQVLKSRLLKDLPGNEKDAKELEIPFEKLQQYVYNRKIDKMVDEIISSGMRASNIVKNMLSFARKDSETKVLSDIPKLLDSTIEIAANDYNLKKKYDFRQIKIIRDYLDNLPQIPCEPTKIQQVFLNILKNGAHAMLEKEYNKEEPTFNLKIFTDAEFLNIEISDNGPGMSEEVKKRIFEPFFTTKSVGSGTGLGMSVSYFIINDNHKGKMEVESQLGFGTKFIIKLPIQAETK